MGLDIEETEERLAAASRAQVVRPDADGTFAFSHDLVRETLAADVGRERRRRLHQAIGETLEAQGDADSPRRVADLAFHFAAAGDTTRGVAYSLAAGERALRASAAADAIAHYRTADRLLESSGDDRSRAVALTGLGDAATLGGDYPLAAEAYQLAQALWRRGGDATASARAWRGLGRVRWRQEMVTEAHDALVRSLTISGPGDDPETAETLLLLADLHATSLGRHAEGIAYADRALAMVERLGERRLEATAYCVVGNVKARTNDLLAGRALLERALALAREIDDPALAAETCGYLGVACGMTGDVNRAREVQFLRLDLARRTGDLYQLRHVDASLALLEMGQGRWAEAERFLARQEQILEDIQSPEPRATLHMERGMLHHFQGRFDEAERECRAAVDLVRAAAAGALIWFLGPLGLALAELGRRDDARDCFAESQALAEALDERASARLFAFTHLAVGYDRLGDPERTAACYSALLPFRGQFAPNISVDRALGIAAMAGRDPAAARLHLAEAEVAARAAGMQPELALTLLQRGRLERDFGAGPSAPSARPGDLLAEGRRLCAELGMQELGRRTLNPLPAASGHRAQRTERVAGLSPREVDVLQLVAQGRTNREIAAALFLSEKTVARHLTTIFAKTGVENRAGAVAFALRHDLA
jgi:DNA-binding CsgD family transcriptional regulator/tetratricopeptide (TPR) repeat protein